MHPVAENCFIPSLQLLRRDGQIQHTQALLVLILTVANTNSHRYRASRSVSPLRAIIDLQDLVSRL
ncbi:MAG TPA: hypothetical protein VEI57_18590 [Nitrospirota bacterium]|nr:hypothetical protein [Nitrospirota bacterium]